MKATVYLGIFWQMINRQRESFLPSGITGVEFQRVRADLNDSLISGSVIHIVTHQRMFFTGSHSRNSCLQEIKIIFEDNVGFFIALKNMVNSDMYYISENSQLLLDWELTKLTLYHQRCTNEKLSYFKLE